MPFTRNETFPAKLLTPTVISYAAWPGLRQVYRLERQFQWRRNGRCYRTSCKVELGITSLARTDASPARILEIRRAHWGIETGLHYRRDVTLKEDATRMTLGNMGKIMASINNLILSLIRQAKFSNAAQARRWFADHIPDAFTLDYIGNNRFIRRWRRFPPIFLLRI